MHLIDFLEENLTVILNKMGYDYKVNLVVSGRAELGDYQYNGVFEIAKKEGKNPKELAEEIVVKFKETNYFEHANAAGPFINLTISNDLLVGYVNDILKDDGINIPKVDKKHIFIDYGGPNIAKELHVGHLRSANIGEAIKRLLLEVGYEVTSDVHLGDWGRPMGLIIREIKEMYPNLPYFDESFKGEYPSDFPLDIKELNEIYPRASIKAAEDEDYLNEARQITATLQSGHIGYTELWKKFFEVSSNDIKEIFEKLNVSFDLWEGESDADKYIPEMMDYLTKNNLTEKSEGAIVINVKEDEDKREIPPVILIKSDGGVLYDTTELATIYYRVKRFNPDKILYLTDNRQELHFVAAFRAAYKTNIAPSDTELEHLGFGTMNGPDGKPFKTRDGGVLSLKSLIEMVTKETRKVIKDNIKEEDKDALAEKLAITAIKYADLLPNRASDYIFDPVKFSDINGKTGPYLVYSTVRMNSLINKCKKQGFTSSKYIKISTKEEREIILNLLNMKTVLEKSLNTKSLNELADYLYKLTNSFNAFYGAHEVISEKEKEKQDSYLALVNLVYSINKRLLNILAIEVVDKI